MKAVARSERSRSGQEVQALMAERTSESSRRAYAFSDRDAPTECSALIKASDASASLQKPPSSFLGSPFPKKSAAVMWL